MSASARPLSWNAVFDALLVSHVGGDFLLQTEWQALIKAEGLGSRQGRRALGRHVSTYTAAYLPALAWVALCRGPRRALSVGALVAVPHVLIDDGRAVRWWLRQVKHVEVPDPTLRLMVDQSAHLLCLLAAALHAAG